MPGSTYNYSDPGLATSTSLVNDLAPLWLQDELLAVAEKLTVFSDIGDKPTMPDGQGKNYSAQRYERLALPGAPLSEGITPDATPLVVNKVQAMLEQWGMVVSLTDVAELTTKHSALTAAKDRLGNASAELQDREIQKVLMGAGQVVFPGGKTSRSTLVAGDVPTTDFISSIVATLRQLGAPTFPGEMYAGVVDPYCEMDIAKDQTFVASHQYANTEALMNAEIGRWRGVRWKRSNLLPIVSVLATGAGGASATNQAAGTGETGFTAGSTVKVVVALADPISGLDVRPIATATVTNAAAYTVVFTITAAAPEGRYNVYVSAEGGTVPTYQTTVQKPVGAQYVGVVAKAVTSAAATTSVGYSATGAPAGADAPATGTVHTGYVFGKSAFAVPAIGSRVETTLTPATASDSDPLKQRRKAGFKFLTKTCILNTDFFRRFECQSFYG
jgi:N4-gp56 family major capsid protein